MRTYLLDLTKKKNVVYCGDLNVAHEEIDIKNAKANRGNAAAAARKLNLSERIINYKISKYAISTSWFKPR